MKRLLPFIFILLIIAPISSLFSQIPTNGLVAYYPFNGNANDESGNGNNGTNNGATLVSDRFGNINSAYNLNTGDVTSISLSPFSLPGIGAISIWFKPDDNGSTSLQGSTLISNLEKYVNHDAIIIYHHEGKISLIFVNSAGAAFEIVSNDLISIDNWHHIICQIDGSKNLTMYIDGRQQIQTVTWTGSYSGQTVTNLGNNVSDNDNFNGQLDDILIYNRALNTTEIEAIFHENGYADLTDIDGNVYNSVTIGTQVWMKENLKTTKYNDGTSIPIVTDNTSWNNLSTPAYCWYNNDEASNKSTYGSLFNWHTVNTGKLCPTGWHIPSDSEWSILESFLGGNTVAGGKMRESGTVHWTTPNTGATNESGFTALPGGYRYGIGGSFTSLGDAAAWWSSTNESTGYAWARSIPNNDIVTYRYNHIKTNGFSVRCLRDAAVGRHSISSFTPSYGPAGTSVIITGTDFSSVLSDNIVWFGATKAIVTAATTNQLTVTVPQGSTYQPISVTVNGLTSYSSKPFNVTFSSAQVVDGSSFATKVDFTTGTSPIDIAVADFDGDGMPDIVTPNQNSNTISVFRNTSTSGTINGSSFSSKVDFTAGTDPVRVAVGDFDGDGKPDIAVTNVSSNSVSVFRNISTSGSLTTASFSPKVDFATAMRPSGLAIGDIDSDGKPDIIAANASSNSFSVLRNTSTAGTIDANSFAAKVDFTAGSVPSNIIISDIDEDGKPDVISADYSSNSVSVHRNTSTSGIIDNSSFATKVDIITGAGPYTLAASDFDGDGKNDLAVANYNVNTISIFRNTSSSGSITSASFAAKVDYSADRCEGISVGDIDGDSKPDIVATNYNGGLVSVLKNNSSSGSVNFSPKVDYTAGTMPQGVGICDFDGDGKPDIVVSNSSSTSNSISIFRNTMSATPPPSAPVAGTITHPTCTVATGSVAMSGLPSSGTWTLTRSPGGTTTQGTGTTTTISGLVSGTYTFTVTNASGVTSAASASIVINIQPSTPSSPVVGTITQPTCSVQTGSVQLTGLPSASSWTLTRSTDNSATTGSGTSTTITGLPVGTFTYTVTNSSGCTSVASASITINVAPGTPATPTAGTIVQPACLAPTGSVTLNGLPSGNWTLNRTPGGTTNGNTTSTTVTNLSPGTYSFTVTNAAGCTSAALGNIVIQPVPTGYVPVIGKKWNSVLVCYNVDNAFTSWQWYRGAEQVSTVTTKAFYNTNKVAGSYRVYTTDKDGCKNYSNNIDITAGSKGVIIYPNPAAERITISISDESTGKAVFSFYNSSGMKVLEDQTDKPDEVMVREIQVKHLEHGIYTIKITVNQKDISHNRLVISR